MARQLHGAVTRLPVVLRGDDPRQRDSRGTIAGWSDSGEALASPSVSRHPEPNPVFSQSRNGRGRDGRTWFWRPPGRGRRQALRGEPPVHCGARRVAFLFLEVDVLLRGILIWVASLETRPCQHTDLVAAMFSHPCLGVWWNSSRLATRRASEAGKFPSREATR